MKLLFKVNFNKIVINHCSEQIHLTSFQASDYVIPVTSYNNLFFIPGTFICIDR